MQSVTEEIDTLTFTNVFTFFSDERFELRIALTTPSIKVNSRLIHSKIEESFHHHYSALSLLSLMNSIPNRNSDPSTFC